jgi:hypothetical protein
MMKKLIAFTALAGLIAAGCASPENRGGSVDSHANPAYGTVSSYGTNKTTSPSSTGSASGSVNSDTANSPSGVKPTGTTDQSTPNPSNNPSSNPNSSSNPNNSNP